MRKLISRIVEEIATYLAGPDCEDASGRICLKTSASVSLSWPLVKELTAILSSFAPAVKA